MDLLKTILLYMTMVFASSVQNAPEPTPVPAITPTPVAVVGQAVTPGASAEATPKPTAVPTPDITPNNQYKTIKVGDNGELVSQMQRRLAELGYYTGDLDGRFGNQTRRAVERFQYNNGLSADGIAGKRTLTVLFESEDVVAFTEAEATPSAEASARPTESIKPEVATLEPTFIPTPTPTEPSKPEETVANTQAPALAPENETSPEPLAGEATAEVDLLAGPTGDLSAGPTLIPLEDVGFVPEGEAERMTLAAEDSGEPSPLIPLEKDGETILVPFLKILENLGVVVVPSVTEQRAEYAFAILDAFYHLSYGIGENGVPGDVTITTNGAPQLLADRIACLEDGMLYLPLAGMEKWTGVTFTLDEETQLYTVTLPAQAN